MRRDIAGSRPIPGIVAAGLIAVAMALAGCGGSSGTAGTTSGGGSSSAAAGSSGSSSEGSSGSPSSGGSLATSKLVGLTKLQQPKLCGVLSTSEAAQILGSSTAAPAYANRLGFGPTCEWIKAAAGQLSSDELYVGLSTVLDWAGAQDIDKMLKTSQATIDGHPALTADKQHGNDYALVHVALGGEHDPVVEFRAPTLAIATQLATTVTPRLLALS